MSEDRDPTSGLPGLAAAPELPSGDALNEDYVVKLIARAHRNYNIYYRLSFLGYHLTRLVAGGAALAIFSMRLPQEWVPWCSISIALCTLLDWNFDFKGKAQIYSQATDLLRIAGLKRAGLYKRFKEEIDVLARTEDAALARLQDLNHVLRAAEQEKHP